MTKYQIRWTSGASKGIITTVKLGGKIRIGTVRTGAWGAKYKVISRIEA